MLTFKSFFVGTTKGIDVINIGHDLRGLLREAKLESGMANIAFRQPRAALALLANDSKTVAELKSELGSSTLTAILPLLPPLLTIPIEKGKLSFEPWQDLFLVDYDTIGRRREVLVQFYSETAEPAPKGRKN